MSQGAFFSLLIIIVIFFKKSSNNFSRTEIFIMTRQIFGRNPPITPSAASLPFRLAFHTCSTGSPPLSGFHPLRIQVQG
jgi:hypothetical protein